MRMPRLARASALALAVAGAATAAAVARAAPTAAPARPLPTAPAADAFARAAPVAPIQPVGSGACAPLPAPRSGPLPFPTGEKLTYDVDVMGVRAATMTTEVLPRTSRAPGAHIPFRVRVESNTFFDKIRRVRADIVSNLRARDLRPDNFREDLFEGGATRIADVSFPSPGGDRVVQVDWRTASGATGQSRHAVAPDALDYAGAVQLFRTLPLSIGQSFCFDSYGLKRIWRVQARVEAREHISVPAGEFSAWHISGMSTRVGPNPGPGREFHIWISDDARRLPLAAMGVIDLGAVRASLSAVRRPDGHIDAARPSGMEW